MHGPALYYCRCPVDSWCSGIMPDNPPGICMCAIPLQGKLALPSVEDQEADVAAFQAWKRSFAPPGNNRAANLQVILPVAA